MNTTAGRMSYRRLILVPILILFILSLVFLNRQLLLAGRRMNSLIAGYENTLQEWTRIRTVIILGGGSYIRTPVELNSDLERLRRWFAAPELERLSRFSALRPILSDLDIELASIPAFFSQLSGPSDIRRIARIDAGLSDIQSVLVDFRDRLDNGFAFLVQSQVFLILLLVLLVIFELDSRIRHQLKFRMAQDMQGRIVRAQEEERNRIALDLHDDIAQELSWMRINLVNRQIEPGFLEVMDQLIKHVRDMSEHLRTPNFSREFFGDAVQDMIDVAERRSGIKAHFLPGTISPGVYPELYGHVYRILQECLNNSRKHAGSCRVFIEIQEEGSHLYCEYRDDGAGFDMSGDGWKENMGMRGIRDRILMTGGEFTVDAAPGKGMALRFRTPLAGYPHAD